MERTLSAVLLILGMIVMIPISYAQTPQETLRQYVSELQKNPSDNALREKIIKHVRSMRQAPRTPEEVDELIGQAKYVFKHAKTQEDYLGAVEAYKKIVNIAPWVGDNYFNLGVAQEQAGQLNDAIASFKLYLLASPDAKDAREVRERIGGLKYAVEHATTASRPEPAAAKPEDEYVAWLKKLDGARFAADAKGGNSGLKLMGPVRDVIDIRGDEAVARDMLVRFDDQETARLNPYIQPGVWRERGRDRITNGQFTLQEVEGRQWSRLTCTIAKDGNKVTCNVRDSYNQEFVLVYYRSMEP